MSDEDAAPSPFAGVVEGLAVRRNAKVGALVGLLLGVGTYLLRVFEVFGPFQGTRQYPVVGPEGWFLVLAFVLATTTALLVATVLTLIAAYRRAKEL